LLNHLLQRIVSHLVDPGVFEKILGRRKDTVGHTFDELLPCHRLKGVIEFLLFADRRKSFLANILTAG
jgi:hypothetical protein